MSHTSCIVHFSAVHPGRAVPSIDLLVKNSVVGITP